MSAETDLNSALLSDSFVTAIVGGDAAARIYPDFVPPDAPLPSIAYSRTGTEFIITIHAAAPVAEDVTFEIQCMSLDRTQADTLAEACIAALGPAQFRAIDRRADFDSENEFRGTVLVMQHFVVL